ncbi:MAG: SAM-dependent methyltransferase [Peptostreptococcaceae bacterium]|nr:SAM-dependent methyltransferase [Peptostreptococcaceae bacterium]
MNTLSTYILNIVSNLPYKMVISSPAQKTAQYRKIVIGLKKGYYQVEKYTQKQVFHENIEHESIASYCARLLSSEYRELNAWDENYKYNIKISKKGKVFFGKSKEIDSPSLSLEHNRKKKYILAEGKTIEPLIDMGIFTKDGKIVNSMQDKYRQINRFVEIIDDAIRGRETKKLNVIDFGCGKSYLTFILYYYFTEIKGIEVNMVGLDLKEDVIEKCNLTSKKYGYGKLHFEVGDINGYKSPEPVDMVITLHACDTATDYALYNAIKWDAEMIFSAPCCQHELNSQMKSDAFSILTRYGLIKERVAALFTDSIRGNLLEYCGYKTQLLEFIDYGHTPKNIMIRAVKSNMPQKRRDEVLSEVVRINEEFSLRPKLLELLKDGNMITVSEMEKSKGGME